MNEQTKAMFAGVESWIEQCRGRMDGAQVLRKRVQWLEELITLQGQGRKAAPLEGIAVWHSQKALDMLRAAAQEMSKR